MLFWSVLPYLVVILASFYVLPMFILDAVTAILILWLALPAIVFICSFIYGKRSGFSLLLPIMTGIIFVPTIFTAFYKDIAGLVLYLIIYIVISLIGNIVGTALNKHR